MRGQVAPKISTGILCAAWQQLQLQTRMLRKQKQAMEEVKKIMEDPQFVLSFLFLLWFFERPRFFFKVFVCLLETFLFGIFPRVSLLFSSMIFGSNETAKTVFRLPHQATAKTSGRSEDGALSRDEAFARVLAQRLGRLGVGWFGFFRRLFKEMTQKDRIPLQKTLWTASKSKRAPLPKPRTTTSKQGQTRSLPARKKSKQVKHN